MEYFQQILIFPFPKGFPKQFVHKLPQEFLQIFVKHHSVHSLQNKSSMIFFLGFIKSSYIFYNSSTDFTKKSIKKSCMNFCKESSRNSFIFFSGFVPRISLGSFSGIPSGILSVTPEEKKNSYGLSCKFFQEIFHIFFQKLPQELTLKSRNFPMDCSRSIPKRFSQEFPQEFSKKFFEELFQDFLLKLIPKFPQKSFSNTYEFYPGILQVITPGSFVRISPINPLVMS